MNKEKRPDVPNTETAAAMEEVDRMKADPGSVKSYKNFREAMEDMERKDIQGT